MTALAEFLKAQAERLHSEEVQRAQKRDEWLQAVERLLAQMEAWLRQADTANVLQVRHIQVEKREEGIGVYLAPGLVITLDTRQVEIVPRGRNAVGAIRREDNGQTAPVQGRVDITDGVSKSVLYRVTGAQGDEWFLVDDRTPRADVRARPFDNAAFEAVLLSLLR